MANVNAPFGLKPLRKLGGGNINQTEYSIATTYATAIYTGDPVQLTSTSSQIAQAEAGNVDNIGVFCGCSYTDSTGATVFSPYWPGVSDGKTDIKAWVVDDPDVIFEMQADACAATEIGLVVVWNLGTGSTKSGLSGAYAVVNGTSSTSGAGKGLRVMRLINRPDNAYGTYAKIEVMFAEHSLARVVSSVGGV